MPVISPLLHVPEHGIVVNITTRTLLPPNYDFLPNTSPTTQLVFCRTLTLAQGRILYDVWDAEDPGRHVGYVLPSPIVAESRNLPKASVYEEWKHLPHHRRERLLVAWEMTSRLFPRIPIFAARKVAERMARLMIMATRLTVEEAVMWFALREFTAYAFLLETAVVEDMDWLKHCENEERVKEAVRPSLRMVLMNWLPGDLTTRQELDFCCRHELLTNAKIKMEKGLNIQRFGGKETACNLAY